MGEINTWLVFGGLTVGAVFAFLVQHFRFCLVASTSNLILINDYRQAIAFAAALLVAITGTQLLEMTELVAIAESSYRNSKLDWFGAVFGGIVFGVGATLAGGCAARTLVRTMEGSMHALIALVSFVIVAAIVQFGFLEPVRVILMHATAIELTTDAGIASILSVPSWLVLALIDTVILVFIYKGWQRSPDKTMLYVGCIIGGLVIVGWYITGVLAQDEFMPATPSSVTVSGPLARLGYFMMSGRMPAISFAVSFVAGTAITSLLLALAARQFKITAPGKGMAKMAILGGTLMGIGSIFAYGCNIGQGMSGISTLSIESLIAVIGMVVGIILVTKWMEKAA
ncbi:MAG: YeeE/YedE family protein [Gammaproteobacteria bacterium]|nr:YeeE/YedE family protein [Gammaproteobacteria bacterium]